MSARKRLAGDIAGLKMGGFDTVDDGAAPGDFTKAKKRREVDTDEIQLCDEGRNRSASLSPHLDCCGGQDQDMEECTKFLPIRDALLRSLHQDDHSRAAARSIEGDIYGSWVAAPCSWHLYHDLSSQCTSRRRHIRWPCFP
jgi:hypothetical protein